MMAASSTSTPKASRTICIADAKGGSLWRPVDHNRILSGHLTKGWVGRGIVAAALLW